MKTAQQWADLITTNGGYDRNGSHDAGTYVEYRVPLSDDDELYHDVCKVLQQAMEQARAEGFKAGIETAAALCEQFETDGGTHLGTMLQTEVTPRIRALADKESGA